MKKISLIVLIVFTSLLSGCDSISFLNNDKKQIETETAAAIDKIKKAAQDATEEAEHKISSSATSKLGEASKEIEAAIQMAQVTISENVSKEANEQISARLKDTKKQIDNSMEVARLALLLSLVAIGLGVVVIVILFDTRKKCREFNIRRIIYDSLDDDEQIKGRVKQLIDSRNSVAQLRPSLSRNDVERILDEFICSKKFEDILHQHIATSPVPKTDVSYASKVDNTERTVAKVTYLIYAKESNSMVLSNIQDTYQKGKSIYKLIMSEPNASTAEVSVCIEQEEVKQRILKFDSQYLEPICSVTRSSNDPTQVVIKTTGTAERIGEEWKVIRPIIVEIK